MVHSLQKTIDTAGLSRSIHGRQGRRGQRAVCDYTGDNVITTRDALAILKTAVGTGPEPMCPAAGCNGPECKPTCPCKEANCCNEWTCSGNGLWTLEGNATQNDNCGPGEFGSGQPMRWSDVGGMKLYNCFSDGCAIPRFGDASP